ncbi:MAG TPA: ComEC/Rec2 family competence protein [Candidatus Paceibacterota bacterium]|jgi:competence protein ComEC|nr:ComEC/Rec2 family competence protein [Candidatus Paceibacterota bacterium]
MNAYFFYAAVSGFLSGVFFRTLEAIPDAWPIVLCVLGCACGVIAFAGKEQGREDQMGRALRLFALTGIVSLSAAFGIWRASIAPMSALPAFDTLFGTKVSLEGTIVAPPDMRESSDRLTVQLERNGAKMRIIASAPLTAAFHVGDRVRVSGTLAPPAPFDSDGGRIFRYDQFLAKDGIFGVVQPAQAAVIGRDPDPWLSFLRFLQSIKDAFDTATEQAIPQPESALAIGIIAGGKQGLGMRLLDAFTIAGMLQIVVLSGYNVMIVAEGVLAALRAVPKRAALVIAAAVISLFVLAAGAGSSAVRAGIMALLALTARGTHRSYDVLRSLFAALVLMLLWNPLLLAFDPGLQLSFMATLGLVLLSKPIELRLVWIGSPMLREMLATTLAAQIAVLPLLLYQSGNLSLVAIPANVLAMPVLPAAMALSAIAAACAFVCNSFVPMLSLIAGIPAYVLLAYVIGIAEYSARIPYANIILPAFPAWWLVPAYALIGWLVLKMRIT